MNYVTFRTVLVKDRGYVIRYFKRSNRDMFKVVIPGIKSWWVTNWITEEFERDLLNMGWSDEAINTFANDVLFSELSYFKNKPLYIPFIRELDSKTGKIKVCM